MKKNDCWESQGKCDSITPIWKKRIEINNKEILKNNILINIKFFDVGGIVKWYDISNKVTFSDGKIE